MDPQAVLERLLDPNVTADDDAEDGGDLTEIDSASETLEEWLRGGGFIPTADAEDLARLRGLAEYHETRRKKPGSDSKLRPRTAKALADRLYWLVGKLHRSESLPSKRSLPKTKAFSDKLTINDLAEMFSLPSWDRVEDANMDYIAEAGEDEDAQQQAANEVYKKWEGAVLRAAEDLFEKHGLVLKFVKKTGAFQIVPEKSWRDAAAALMTTINGVGQFEYSNVKEFLEATGTPRETVLSHIHWIKRYPDVYGTANAKRLYERSW